MYKWDVSPGLVGLVLAGASSFRKRVVDARSGELSLRFSRAEEERDGVFLVKSAILGGWHAPARLPILICINNNSRGFGLERNRARRGAARFPSKAEDRCTLHFGRAT